MSLRLIIDAAQTGPVNMAADEALLSRVGAGTSPPTLRLYQWSPPTVSLGYFQRYADYKALPPPAGKLTVVRRLTGGGAILHDQELTYSLVLPLGHAMLQGGPNRLYETMHAAVIGSLNALGVEAWTGCQSDDSGAARGPFFCFARRHCFDVLIGDDKVAGSAQRRTRDAVLQHGSIVLTRRFDQQPAASALRQSSSHTADEIGQLFLGQITLQCGMEISEGAWSADERANVDALTPKYAGAEWTRRC